VRGAGEDDAVSVAAGIFLDVVNVFRFFLELFGRERNY
jgi:FtsH-binding integral membrane protein